MTKNYFFRVILLGVSLLLLAFECTGLINRILDQLMQIVNPPQIVTNVIQFVFRIFATAAIAFLAVFIYKEKYNQPQWVSSTTSVQLIIYIGVALVNTILNFTRFLGKGLDFRFNYWMISGFLFDIVFFGVLIGLTIYLKNAVPEKPSQVRYSTNVSIDKTDLSQRKSNRTTPPDLPTS